MEIVIAIVAFVIGLVIGVLAMRGGRQQQAAQADALRMQLDDAKARE